MAASTLAIAAVLCTVNFSFNVFSKKPASKASWQLLPLPQEGSGPVKPRVEKKSLWHALSRYGRVYYTYTDDPLNDELLLVALHRLHSQTARLAPTEQLQVVAFVFACHDLWEGETLYQFMQGLQVTAQERRHASVEAQTRACLEFFYEKARDCRRVGLLP